MTPGTSRWCRSRIRAIPAALTFAAFAAAGAQAGRVTVGPNVHVSQAHASYPIGEVLLTADPVDRNRLLGCAIIYMPQENRRTTAVYLSTDGGKSWSSTLETKGWQDSADPACAFGPNGLAHHIAIGTRYPAPYALAVWRSTDGGRTWQEQESISMKHQGIDRESLIADVTGGPFNGRVYVTGESSVRTTDGTRSGTNGMGVWVSADSGKTFGGPLKLLSPGNRYTLGVGNSAMLSDGTLAFAFGELRNSDGNGVESNHPGKSNAVLSVSTSSDGGESISAAVKVDDYYMVWPPSPADAAPTIAADRWSSAFRDRLYVTWTDERSGRAELYFSSSSDRGKTWSRAVTINDDRPFPDGKGPNQFMPTIAVNTNGVVGVMWYDRREHPDNMGWHVRFRASLDGGETWLPSVKVSSAPNDFDRTTKLFSYASVDGGGSGGYNRSQPPREGPLSVNIALQGRQFNAGDYAGLAADAAGVFHPFWIDNRTGLQQIWTAPVTVDGLVAKHGGGTLAGLDDVSSKVTLELTESVFNRSANTVTVAARFRNTSRDTLEGPFRGRIVRLRSSLASGIEMASSGRSGGAGAVIDFTELVGSGVLLPNARSEPRRLTFRLSDLKPLREGTEYNLALVQLEIRIFARLRGTSPM